MGSLRIHLFGRIRVMHHEDGPELNMTPTAQTLLAYLLVHRAPTPREILASLCWGEQPQEHARNCLSTALWRLRRALEPTGVPRGTYLLSHPTGEVSFNWGSGSWIDLYEFETCASVLLKRPPSLLEARDVHRLETALDLCAGELFEGLYDDWALRERERVCAMILDSLAHLMVYHRTHGDDELALLAGQRILASDPLREEVHRDMMGLFARAGQRVLAVKQYLFCREILAAELGIEPMPETQDLFHQIAPEIDVADCALASLPGEPNLAAAIRQLRQAMQELDVARTKLHRAVAAVERLTGDGHD